MGDDRSDGPRVSALCLDRAMAFWRGSICRPTRLTSIAADNVVHRQLRQDCADGKKRRKKVYYHPHAISAASRTYRALRSSTANFRACREKAIERQCCRAGPLARVHSAICGSIRAPTIRTRRKVRETRCWCHEFARYEERVTMVNPCSRSIDNCRHSSQRRLLKCQDTSRSSISRAVPMRR